MCIQLHKYTCLLDHLFFLISVIMVDCRWDLEFCKKIMKSVIYKWIYSTVFLFLNIFSFYTRILHEIVKICIWWCVFLNIYPWILLSWLWQPLWVFVLMEFTFGVHIILYTWTCVFLWMMYLCVQYNIMIYINFDMCMTCLTDHVFLFDYTILEMMFKSFFMK